MGILNYTKNEEKRSNNTISMIFILIIAVVILGVLYTNQRDLTRLQLERNQRQGETLRLLQHDDEIQELIAREWQKIVGDACAEESSITVTEINLDGNSGTIMAVGVLRHHYPSGVVGSEGFSDVWILEHQNEEWVVVESMWQKQWRQRYQPQNDCTLGWWLRRFMGIHHPYD